MRHLTYCILISFTLIILFPVIIFFYSIFIYQILKDKKYFIFVSNYAMD